MSRVVPFRVRALPSCGFAVSLPAAMAAEPGSPGSPPGSPRLGLSELSADTLAALQSMLRERAAAAETAAADPFRHAQPRTPAGLQPPDARVFACSGEDWGKSQFIYDKHTAQTVAAEVAALGGSVACVSCPTLFRTLKARRAAIRGVGRGIEPHTQPSLTPTAAPAQDDFPGVACHLLEFDERYSCRGDFTLYDYNEPLAVPDALRGAFDVVVADPPYLAEECLLKTAECVIVVLMLCVRRALTRAARQDRAAAAESARLAGAAAHRRRHAARGGARARLPALRLPTHAQQQAGQRFFLLCVVQRHAPRRLGRHAAAARRRGRAQTSRRVRGSSGDA